MNAVAVTHSDHRKKFYSDGYNYFIVTMPTDSITKITVLISTQMGSKTPHTQRKQLIVLVNDYTGSPLDKHIV
jgi:hypothetical protein